MRCTGRVADENVKFRPRETWSKNIDFIFACVGFSVGLGNVWRFPFLCYKNGGGAFLIPYVISVLIVGFPMYFLEVAVGQFTSQGGVKAWKISPLFQGVGYASIAIIFIQNCYYNVILTWAVYYLFSSFTLTLPWASCDNEWNTPDCHNGTIHGVNGTQYGPDPLTSDPSTEFWENKVLGLTSSVEDAGAIKWDLCLCLLLAWVVVYFCIWKGVKSTSKVTYFTVPTPYILMFILLVRALTLDGAVDGVKFYLIPDFSKLADKTVWVDAVTQVFYSYCIGMTTLLALGSYNRFNHNCLRDTLVLCCINSGTSFLAGFVIFATLGFMANKYGLSVADVAESGPGLAFVAYPEALAQMPIATLWSILFFLMIILIGLDSQFVAVEGFITAIVDLYPNYLRVGNRREVFIAIVCVVNFLVGLSMVTHGGMYVFQLFDYYAASRILILLGIFDSFIVAYAYGADKFLNNIQMMLGYPIPKLIFKIIWKFAVPVYASVIFCLGFMSYSELTYKRKSVTYSFPLWSIGLGWTMALLPMCMIPAIMVIRILSSPGDGIIERIRQQLKPILSRHQLLPGEDLSKVVLEEYEPVEKEIPLKEKINGEYFA